MKHVIVGTAGHIDHGKSKLVEALTGIDPDRLKEEKERGITIDIGFAHLDLGEGLRLGFIDVPGHERFVKNMLAGVWGIDIVLLVIAADESVMPQTREHFDIMKLLGIRKGIVALTKIDLVELDIRELVRLEVQEYLRGSFLEHAPLMDVSAKTGEGIEALKAVLRSQAMEVPEEGLAGEFRLYVDRCFTMKGFGTVITGTSVSGTVEDGETLELLPSGKKVRVRGLEVHNEKVSRAFAGQRTAINLGGVEVEGVDRGHQLVRPGLFETTYMLDARLQILASSERGLKDRERVRFHHGASEIIGRVRVIGASTIPPGGSGFVQIRLERQTLCFPGDRFILRRYSPVLTIGGGVILDNAPAKKVGDAGQRVASLQVLEKGSLPEQIMESMKPFVEKGFGVKELQARLGLTEKEILEAVRELEKQGAVTVASAAPLHLLSKEGEERLREGCVRELEAFHRGHPLAPGLSKEELREKVFRNSSLPVFKAVLGKLKEEGRILIEGETVAMAGRGLLLSPEEARAKQKIEEAFRKWNLNPLSLKDVPDLGVGPETAEKLLKLLLKEGVLILIGGGVHFHAEPIENLRRLLIEYGRKNEKLSIAAFKEMTGTSRKYAIPLLEYFDRERVTRREGASGDRVIRGGKEETG